MNDNTKEAVDTAANDVRKDSENAVKHGLSHLESEFVTYFAEIGASSKADAKKLLAWVESKLHPAAVQAEQTAVAAQDPASSVSLAATTATPPASATVKTAS